VLYIKAGLPVWPVHGSYAGRCGQCVVYTDRPLFPVEYDSEGVSLNTENRGLITATAFLYSVIITSLTNCTLSCILLHDLFSAFSAWEKYGHIQHVLYSRLYWLPVLKSIQFKLSAGVQGVTDLAPTYLAVFVVLCQPWTL